MTKFSADWSRRTFLRGALATGALVLPGSGALVGCATSGDGQEATEGEKTKENPLGVPTDAPIEIYIFNGGFGDAYATDIHQPMYKEKYPKAKITHKAEVDIAGALQSRFVGGNPPDFVNDSGDGQIPLGQLVSDKQLYELTELFDAPSWDDPNKTVRETLVPGAVEYGTFGKPYVMNMALSVFGIWYDKALFDKNGWQPPATWDDMLTLCAEIKKAGIAPWTYPGQHARYMVWPLLSMAAKLAGPDILKDIDNLKEGAWGHEAVKEAANALAGLRAKGYVLSGTEGMDHIQAQGQWCQGKAAFVPCGSWLENEQKDAPKAAGFEFAVMPEPLLSDDSAMPLETLYATPGEPYVVPAAAKNPRGGLEYMRIMLSKEGAKGFTEQVSSLTIVEGAADGVELPPGLASAQQALDAAGDNVFNYLWYTWYGDMWNPGVNSQMQDLLAGRKTVDEWVEGCEAEAKKVRDDDSITKYTR